MARIKATRGKGKEFFLNHLSCNDYYSENERVQGIWHGSLAGEFGLDGAVVDSTTFSLLQQNINPLTHERLTQRTVAGGIRFYDFQCSAQKSVSVMALFDEGLAEAHREAVHEAMAELERFAAVRIRKGANVNTQNHELTGKVVYAGFHHDVSRLLDPQLHTHNVVCNVTKDSDGNYKALENTEMCRAIRFCGRVYQNALALACRKLGYEIEESLDFRGEVKGFELKGVPEEVLERFSKRTRDIDEEVVGQERKLGRPLTAAEKHEISLETRSVKLLESDSETVRRSQLAQISPEELLYLREISVGAFRRGTVREPIGNAAEALEEVLPELFERISILKPDKILAEALTRNLGKFPLTALKSALAKAPELRSIGEGYLAPEAVIEAEQYVIDAIERERGLSKPLNGEFMPFASDAARQNQAAEIRGILRSRDRFTLLRGVAGSGKTSTLKELARGLSRPPLLLAPTNSAAEVLKREGFPQAQTVAGFLLNPPPFDGLVIVDESGLNSLRDGVALLQLAEKRRFRVLFVGDSRQHHAVDRGDFFRLLENHSTIQQFSLTEIFRQQAEEYRQGIRECSEGNFAAAFERFDRNGYIRQGGADYLRLAAERFVRLHGKEQVIAVAPTHKECDALTAEIRKRLPLGPSIGAATVFRSAQWSRTKLRNEKSYRPGMTVMFIRRLKDVAGPGELAKIAKVDRKWLHLDNGKSLRLPGAADFIEVGETLARELRQGDVLQFKVNLREQKIYNGNLARITDSPGVVELLNQDMQPVRDGLRKLPAGFAGYDFGWVTTSHKAQGRTARNVVVAAQKLERRAFYVACSRGRQSLALFCPDKEYLKSRLERDTELRRNVCDILPPPAVRNYLVSPKAKVKAWNEHYREAERKHQREVTEFERQKVRREAWRAEYLKLNQRKKEYEQYRELPWHQRLKLKIAKQSPTFTNAERDRLKQLDSAYEELPSLRQPGFHLPKRCPLSLSEKVLRWLRRVFPEKQPKFTMADRKLIEFAAKPSLQSLADWLKLRQPHWNYRLLLPLWEHFSARVTKPCFAQLPQTEPQYKQFRREEDNFMKLIEPIYLETAAREEERKMELRRERMEYLQKEREEQSRRESELRQERRSNPMTDRQRRILTLLVEQGRLPEIPAELSQREADELYHRLVDGDPVSEQQREHIRRYIGKANLSITEQELASMTRGRFEQLAERILKYSFKRGSEQQPGKEEESRGRDL